MATHASRRTDKTGKDFEHFCEHLLCLAGLNVDEQVNIGLRPTGGAHNTDLVVDQSTIVSLKYQDVAGTAEEKIPFEFMKLQHAIDDHGYKSATIVVAGPDKAWKWKEYYLSEEFCAKMKSIYPDVRIINHSQFVQEYLYS